VSQHKAGNMVRYICDLCKTKEVEHSSQLTYRLRKRVSTGDDNLKVRSWELCDECMGIIQQQLGPGQVYYPGGKK
jgi:hypothetical protein